MNKSRDNFINMTPYNLILGVTGSVAAKLTPKLVNVIKEETYDEINIVATPCSQYFWDKEDESLENVTLWTEEDEWPGKKYDKNKPIMHIDLRDWADMLVIAPLTANTLAKMVNGIADNLLTSIIRAWEREKPIVIAPAMNTKMWEHPATQEHLEKINQWYNVHMVEPVAKKLACGDEGVGAMADIKHIAEKIKRAKLEYILGKVEWT